MDGVGLVFSGATTASATNPEEEFTEVQGSTAPGSDAPVCSKERTQGIKIPIASGKDSPSTEVHSNSPPASIDVSSASESPTPAKAAEKSRAKSPQAVAAQANCQSDDESDADSLAEYAMALARRRRVEAIGGAKRTAPAVPTKLAEPARNAAQTNAPAAARGRPKPTNPTGSAVAKRVARLKPSRQASDAATASHPTKASAMDCAENDAGPATAVAQDSTAGLLVMLDSAITQCEALSVRSDRKSCADESSMLAMSAGGESRDGDPGRGFAGHAKHPPGSAKASAKCGAKASVKSGATLGQRVSFGTLRIATPELPAAKASGDADITSSANSAGNAAAALQATSSIPEKSRSDGEDSFEGGMAAAPLAPGPRALGAGSASNNSDSGGKGDKFAEQEALVDEWKDIEARTIELRDQDCMDKGKMNAHEDIFSTPITFGEAIDWVNKLQLNTEVLKNIFRDDVEFTQCGCFTRRRPASSIPGLSRRCQQSVDRVFLLSSTDFDFNDSTQVRMLRTAYAKLTRNKVCPMIGTHWEFLGFQHADPRTDLNRSGRLLNVVHFFFFFIHHFEILKSAYLLAQDEEHNFPLVCVCINLTQMVMKCLIEGKLSKLCNASEKDVLDTTCNIFAAALFYFYMQWKTLRRTIRDTEAAMKEVRGLLERKPTKLLQGLAKGVEALKQQASASKYEYTDLDFTGRAPSCGGAQPRPNIPKRLRNYMEQQVVSRRR